MRSDAIQLAGVLGLIAEEVGRDAALRLAAAFGGRSIYVPVDVTPQCNLAKAVGMKDAASISRLLGNGHMLVPGTAIRKHLRMARMLADGVSINDVAGEMTSHVMTVSKLRRRMQAAGALYPGVTDDELLGALEEKDPAQPDLFSA